ACLLQTQLAIDAQRSPGRIAAAGIAGHQHKCSPAAGGCADPEARDYRIPRIVMTGLVSELRVRFEALYLAVGEVPFAHARSLATAWQQKRCVSVLPKCCQRIVKETRRASKKVVFVVR